MESIRILQNTYENLYALTRPLGNFLEEELKNISPKYWRDDYVTSLLQRKGVADKEWERLYEIDTYYLLELLRINWREFRTKSNTDFFSKDNWELFVNKRNGFSILNIRNVISHPESWDYTTDDFNNWKTSFEQAAEQLGTSLPELLYDLHEPEKRRILNIILDNVINPALNCSTLPKEIKKRIVGTKERLEVQNTAAGIIAFFTDALRAKGGKEIYEELSKNGLQSFETIQQKIFSEYYGLSM